MKKYYPIDFDEKGNAVLGNAKNNPTSNSFIPTTWAPDGGSGKDVPIVSVAITPDVGETTPPLASIAEVSADWGGNEIHNSSFVAAQGAMQMGTEYTVTVTPGASYAIAVAPQEASLDECGVPKSFTATAELDDESNFIFVGAGIVIKNAGWDLQSVTSIAIGSPDDK